MGERMITLVGNQLMHQCVIDAIDSQKNVFRFRLLHKYRMIKNGEPGWASLGCDEGILQGRGGQGPADSSTRRVAGGADE